MGKVGMVGGRVRVLAIDGGGVLGVIPTEILAGVERVTGRRVAETFDLIVGTSVGGVLALMLACPGAAGGVEEGARYSAAEVGELFQRRAKRMFTRRAMRKVKCAALACGAIYQPLPMEEVLAEHLGETPMHAARTRVGVTAFDMLGSRLVVMRSDASGPLDSTVVRMREAARAATAAPTYFPPMVVRSGIGGGEVACLIDAGVCVNNPGQVALAEAMRAFGVGPASVTMLSLGCGVQREFFDADRVAKWSRVRWVCPLLRLLTEGRVVDEQLRGLAAVLPGFAYRRIDPDLTGEPKLPKTFDDCRKPRLRAARDFGRRTFEEHRAEIERFLGES